MGWSPGFASAVCREYLRFVYLAMVADGAVTPSEEVDQAWHLHLVYTRSYWDDLCDKVLQRPLHHGPTKGGSEEDHRYFDQYRRTLELYEREFGEKPRDDIWPSASDRFSRIHYLMIAPKYVGVIQKYAAIKAGVHAVMASVFLWVLLHLLTKRAAPPSAMAWGLILSISALLAILFYNLHADWPTRSEPPKKGNSGGSSDAGSGGCGSSGCGGGGCGGGGCGS